MPKIATPRPAPSQVHHTGHRWLVRGERVRLTCGGDELPVEWWDGNDVHQRDGGRWWSPQRATALHRWTDAAERAIARIITSPDSRERALMIAVECSWDRFCRKPGGIVRPLPDPLPQQTQDWLARQRQIAEELAQLALDLHPRLAGERPNWITLRKAVTRHERWLLCAVDLGVLPPPPLAEGRPILPVQLAPPDDDARMRAAEELARDMVPAAP